MKQNGRFVHVARHRPKRVRLEAVVVLPGKIEKVNVRVTVRLDPRWPAPGEVEEAFREARWGRT